MASGGGAEPPEKKEDAVTETPAVDVDPEKKHPLQNKWSLWYFKPDKSRKWEDNLKLVTSFDTVEDFWAVYNHIKPPSTMSAGCDYMLFKEGIQPMWEDKRNKAGGRWLINFERDRRRDDRGGGDKKDLKAVLDECWMETLMCLVGEGFGASSDEVCGAVVQIRPKGDKMAIWTGNWKKEDVMIIGQSYKERLNMHMSGRPPPLVYQTHQDIINKSGSVGKSLHNI